MMAPEQGIMYAPKINGNIAAEKVDIEPKMVRG